MITKVRLFVIMITTESKFSIVYVWVVVEKKTRADPPWYGFPVPEEEEQVLAPEQEELPLEDRDEDTSDEDDAGITMVAVAVVVSCLAGDVI